MEFAITPSLFDVGNCSTVTNDSDCVCCQDFLAQFRPFIHPYKLPENLAQVNEWFVVVWHCHVPMAQLQIIRGCTE